MKADDVYLEVLVTQSHSDAGWLLKFGCSYGAYGNRNILRGPWAVKTLKEEFSNNAWQLSVTLTFSYDFLINRCI